MFLDSVRKHLRPQLSHNMKALVIAGASDSEELRSYDYIPSVERL